jgi:hypothetical protein
MAVEFRWLSNSPPRTATTHSKQSRSLMLSRRCKADTDGRATDLIVYWAIALTMQRQSGKAYMPEAFGLCSPNETLNTVAGLGVGGGWWNALSPG